MGQDDEMLKNKVKNQTTSKVAEKTATAVGGPIAGAAVKGLSKTKTGQAVLSKGAEKIGKNPMTAKQMNSRNQMGASNAPSSGSETSNPNGAPTTSGSAPSTSSDVPNSSMNLGDRLKGAGASALANGVNPESKTGQALNTANDVKATIENVKKIKKIAIISGPFIGYFLIVLVCILGVMAFILGPADTVIQFFRDGWENLKTLVGYKDDEKWELEYYQKLDEVQEAYNKKFGVCIDINLITATLTVDTGTDEFIKEGLNEADSEEAELESNKPDYKRMIKQIELLANMQIKRKVYGLDKKQVEKNKNSRVHEVSREGIPVEFVPKGDDYCRNEDEELSEYAILSEEDPYADIGIDERKEDFNLSDAKRLSGLQDKILQAMAGIKGTPVRDSKTVREIASNDIEPGIFKFLNKKANEERNIEYKFYIPTYTYNEIRENDKLIKYEKICEKELPEDENGKDFAQLDIGELNDMENNVYYWNLMDSFIADYYAEYLPEVEGPLDVDDPRYKKIKNIVEDIYLLYNEMGPSRECENNRYCVDIDINYDSSKLGDSALCPDGIEVVTDGKTELINFEDYIAGVVAAENNWHQGSSIENLKAAAVAARTYAIKSTNYCSRSIKNSTANQTYKPTSDPYVLQAVAETKGIIITRNGRAISTEYDALAYKSEDSNYVTIKQNNQKIPLSWFDESGNSVCKNDLNAARKGNLGMHGRGMSQCGSRYLDSIGYTYDQILSYYYGNDVSLTLTEELDPEIMNRINNSSNSGFAQICNPLISGTSPYGDFNPLNPTGGACMDLSESYWHADNAYKGSLAGECTWYTYGRSLKALVEDGGMSLSEAKQFLNDNFLYRSNNGGEWYKNGSAKGLKSSPNVDDIQPGSIISWVGGKQGWGHVGFVEAVEREGGKVTSITVSERYDAGGRCIRGKNNATVGTYTPEKLLTANGKKFAGTVVIVDNGS